MIARKLVSVQPASLAHEIGHLGQEKFLLRRRKRNRRVERSQPDNRAIEIVERFFVDDRGNFSGQSPGARVFVKNDDFIGLLHGGRNRRAIERRDRAQVDDFDFDSFFAQEFRPLQARYTAWRRK